MTSPVLFLLFNRPDLAEQVFERIREAKPSRLFIAVDGPRKARTGENILVAQNRAFKDRVDWLCEVKTLFRDENLGCGLAVSSAISWFFEHVDAGIILEDDCLPDPSFFRFSEELLDHYSETESVMFIGGSNFQDGEVFGRESYYFSRYAHVWGWATWARAWKTYSYKMDSWRSEEAKAELEVSFENSPLLAAEWKRRFDQASSGKIDTWDYQWCYAIWKNCGLAIVPQENLVTNIGFDIRATHTTDDLSEASKRRLGSVRFPLVHPEEVSRNVFADLNYERLEKTRKVSFPRRLWSWLKRKRIVKFAE